MRLMLFMPLIFIVSISAQAQNRCDDIFLADDGVSLTEGIFSRENQNKPARDVQEQIRRLLQMTAFSKEAVFTEKLILEKGELTLSVKLKENWSLEFDYRADHRSSEVVYRLSKISLVRPNGEVLSVDKGPISLAGTSLNRDHYSFKEWGLELARRDLEIPVVIEGTLWTEFRSWVERADYVRKQEFQQLEAAHQLTRLRMTALRRSTVDYANKVIKKQTFKFALLGAALYLYSKQEEIRNEFILIDPWEELMSKSRQGLSSDELQISLSAELAKLNVEAQVSMEATPVVQPYVEAESFVGQLATLSRIEKNYGGKAQIGYFEKGNGRPLSFKKLNGMLSDFYDLEGDSFLVSFPVSERILLVSASLIEEAWSGEQLYVFAVDKASDPALYEKLRKKLISLNKESL